MSLVAVLAIWGAGIAAVFLTWTWYLSLLEARELPGAAMAWLAGGESRRRLKAIIAARREAEKLPEPAAEGVSWTLGELRGPAVVLADSWSAEPTRLIAPGEPACDDPSCAGCQALRARKAHEAAR